jgi:tight adherence protein C
MSREAAWAVAFGLTLGLGLWSLIAALPRFHRLPLAARVASAILDVSPEAVDYLAARRLDTLPVFAMLGPMRHALEHLSARFTGGADTLIIRLRSAGLATTVEQYRAKQLLWLLGGAAAGALVVVGTLPMRPLPVMLRLLLPAVFALAGLTLCDRMLRWIVRARRQRIVDEFPTVLDFLALCLSAGESIRDALERVARTGTGELSRELAEVTRQARTGVSLAAALHALQKRVGVPALTRCVDAITAALDHGSPLAGVLRAQAGDVRDDAKRILLESAGRKEITMMFPLVFLILPVTVLFAVYPGIFVLRAGF